MLKCDLFSNGAKSTAEELNPLDALQIGKFKKFVRTK